MLALVRHQGEILEPVYKIRIRFDGKVSASRLPSVVRSGRMERLAGR